MKLYLSLFTFLLANVCYSQTAQLSEKFLAELTEQYNQTELTRKTQYFRMMLPLKKKASSSTTVELKAKTTHSDLKSQYVERNQTIGFYAFEFVSKSECSLALDSLLLCFPNFCSKVERDKPLEGKLTPSVYIINSTTIYCIETFCEDENEQWNTIVKKFVDTFADKKSVIILSDCGKLQWTNKSNFK